MMKMLKYAAALTLVVALLLAGCTQQQPTDPKKEVDIATLADDMLAALTVDDEMMEIDQQTITNLYEYDSESIAAFKVYASASMSTANEVAVFKAATEEDVEFIEEMLSYRVQTQKFNYENYVPAEMVKIENAQVMKSGLYVALVVSDNPEPAQKVFQGAF